MEIFHEYKNDNKTTSNCQQHLTQKLELYCENCEEFICLECTIQQHNGHKYNLIGKVLAIPDGVTDVATVGENSTIPIQIRTHEGKLPEKLTQSLECELVSELTGTRIKGSAERRGESQCEVTYTPTIKGIHIKLMGEHIIGSPYCVAANKSPDEKLGECIVSIPGLNRVYGVAFTQSGDIITLTIRPKHPQELPCGCEYLDSIVRTVGHIDIPSAVTSYATWEIKFTFISTTLSKGAVVGEVRVQNLDTMIVLIHYIHLVIDRNALYTQKFKISTSS